MFEVVLRDCEKFLDCDTILFQNGEPMKVALFRDRDTLSSLYFVLTNPTGTSGLCCLPIDATVDGRYNQTQLLLQFKDYHNIFVMFMMPDEDKFKDLINHFEMNLHKMRECEDRMRLLNEQFLESIHLEPEIAQSMMENTSFSRFGARDAYDLRLMRTEVQKLMWERRLYEINTGYVTHTSTYRIAFLTWNVASVKPTHMVLDEILRAFEMGEHPADIVFIGLQEIDMGVVSVVSGTSKVKDQWARIMQMVVTKTKERFVIAAQSALGGVFAAVMFREGAFPEAKCGAVRCIRLGAHGLAANKGAIVFPITVSGARFVFMACHLTPHTENWESRNQQLRQLLDLVKDKYDYLTIMGDLNYRIDLTYEECMDLINENNVKELFAKDQLEITRGEDAEIGRLKEPKERDFLPTYKFDPDSDIYDTSPKHRVPSYTDRVLMKRGRKRMAVGTRDEIATNFVTPEPPNFPAMPKCVIFQRGKCRFSDHRSVLCSFKFEIPVIDEDKLAHVRNVILKERQKLE